MRPTTLLPPLDGPPPSLPHVLDVVSERWWGLAPRARVLVAGALVCVLAVGAGWSATGTAAAPTRVAVASRDLPAGHELAPGDLRTEEWPAQLAPDAAATGDAEGTLTSALPRGAVLTEGHVGTGGLGALVAEGRAAVALPVEVVPDPQVGTVVDLVVTDDPQATPRPVSTGRILHADSEQVWIDLDAARAAEVAAAAARRAVAVVVRSSSASPG